MGYKADMATWLVVQLTCSVNNDRKPRVDCDR